jgi:ribonuclease-3
MVVYLINLRMPFSRIYKLYFSPSRKYILKLRNLLGYIPGNVNLYKMAFRHRSIAVVLKNGTKNSNERLEFLGDAILGSVIAEELFKLYPYKDEGFLTEMRSKIVNRANLNQLAKKLGLGDLIEYDNRVVNYANKQGSLLGDAFEALIGAIYLDKGYNFTKNFILSQIIKPHIDIHTLENTETNFKSKLIEWCQRHGKDVTFEIIANANGDSAKLFTVQVSVDSENVGTGRDYNKKNAEKLAAEKACESLSI